MTFRLTLSSLFHFHTVTTDPTAEEGSAMSFRAIIADVRMLVNVSMVFACFIAISFNDATLAVLLDRFGLNSAYKGAAFLISAVCYSVGAMVYGRIGKPMVGPPFLSDEVLRARRLEILARSERQISTMTEESSFFQRDVRIIAIFGGACLIVAWLFMSPVPIFDFSS